MPLVDIVDVRKSFGPTEVLKGVSVECRARRRGRDHRPFGLGQVDAASLHQRARDLRCRRHRRRRHRCRAVGEGRKAARSAPQCRHGVSAIQSVPASHRGRERDAGADGGEQGAAGRGEGACGRNAGQGRAVRQGRQLSVPALGRTAAAGRDRARARDAAERVAVRRDHLRARSRNWSTRCCAWSRASRRKASR